MASRTRPLLWMVSTIPPMRRCFSSTPAQQAVSAISFEKTSNTELDELLEEVRNEIILPSYLTADQRKKIHKARYARRLELDPIVLEIDGEVKRYKYRHPYMSGLPEARGNFTRAFKLMKTPEDFVNLPPLYEGLFKKANRKISPFQIQRMVRTVGMRGHIGVIMRMARLPEHRGLSLYNPEVVSELLAWLLMPAVDSGFAEAETRKALGSASGVLEVLEQDLHQPSKKDREKWKNIRIFPGHRDPMYLAVRLSMASILAAKYQDGQDSDGRVERHAKQLVELWPAGKGLTALHAPEAYMERDVFRYMTHRDSYLFFVSPILYGLKMTTQVVKEPVLLAQIQDRFETLQQETRCALSAEVRERNARGMKLYTKIFGPIEEQIESEPVEGEPAEPAEPAFVGAETKEAEPEEAEPEEAEPEETEPNEAETKSVETEQAETEQTEPKDAQPEQAEPKEAEPAKKKGRGGFFGLFRS